MGLTVAEFAAPGAIFVCWPFRSEALDRQQLNTNGGQMALKVLFLVPADFLHYIQKENLEIIHFVMGPFSITSNNFWGNLIS